MKSFKYKGWFCEWDGVEEMYFLFTPEQMEQPKGYRDVEWEIETIENAKAFIDSYNVEE
ncbi:MAG: hypothetical protein LBL65_05770 [Campylobacteraceae bacterium]|jgi:hypothetical protein|nr:hypothetical protein [Campylobacteraceae bacterium]